jgi:hypothetical protein
MRYASLVYPDCNTSHGVGQLIDILQSPHLTKVRRPSTIRTSSPRTRRIQVGRAAPRLESHFIPLLMGNSLGRTCW